MPYPCTVCNYPELKDFPRKDTLGLYEICPSCGFQYGIADEARGSTPETWREKWIASGMKWQSLGRPQPNDWDPANQIQGLLSSE